MQNAYKIACNLMKVSGAPQGAGRPSEVDTEKRRAAKVISDMAKESENMNILEAIERHFPLLLPRLDVNGDDSNS